MRALLSLFALLSAVTATVRLSPRQNACQSIQDSCTGRNAEYSASEYCSTVLGTVTTTKTKYVSAVVTVTRSKTVGTCSIPSQASKKMKREDANDFVKVDQDNIVPVARRAAPAPSCLRPYTSPAASLTSACNCFATTGTTLTHTRVTTGRTTSTATFTTARATPTCSVEYTKANGKDYKFKPFYSTCGWLRDDAHGGDTADKIYGFNGDPLPPLCDILNDCAKIAVKRGFAAFQLWSTHYDFDANPYWQCEVFLQGGNVTMPDYFVNYDSHDQGPIYGYKLTE